MKLQVALDGEPDASLALLQAIHPYVDIAEIGTPLIYRIGMAFARQVREAFPGLTLLADLKIMDAGEEEASIAFEAGCDIVTVLGVTHDATVRAAVAASERYGKQVMADLIQVNDAIERSRQLLAMGCHYLCVYTAHDRKDAESPLAPLSRLRAALPDAPLAIAGGITPDMMSSITPLKPEIVVVGSAITQAPDPTAVTRALREWMDGL